MRAGRYGAELVHVPYPCPTRIVAGTTAAEGKDESARMRLEHLVVQREELEERIERLDAVIGLIRRDLGETEKANGGRSGWGWRRLRRSKRLRNRRRRVVDTGDQDDDG